MSLQTVGFIGAGRAARILLGGWKRGQEMPSRVVLFDSNPQAPKALEPLGAQIEAAAEAGQAASQDAVFLAVHPPAVPDAIAAIRKTLKSDSILVSLAPKFAIAKLSELLGGFERIVRMIPNAPSIVGRGYNPLAFSSALGAEEKEQVARLLAPLGDCPEVNERHLEAYAILSAMGPTYFWPQIFALQSLGRSFGLTGEAALQALDKMLWGTVATIKESGLSPEQIEDLIPVKHMAEEVETLAKAYGQKLHGLMEKLRP